MMSMHAERDPHAVAVAAWLDDAAVGLSRDRFAPLLDAAIAALWRRAQLTLGDVTLAAIVDRVVSTCAETYPVFSRVQVRQDGVSFALVDLAGAGLDAAQAREAVASLVVEMLAVLGHLTADILTPALHEELAKVTLAESSQPVARNAHHRINGEDHEP